MTTDTTAHRVIRHPLALLAAALLLGVVFVGLAPGAAAQSGAPYDTCEKPGPDEGGYVCEVASSATWYDLSDGTSVFENNPDDGSASVDLPFSFYWYGNEKGQVHVGSNGILCFTQANCDEYLPNPPPHSAQPNDLIACFWEDLAPNQAGSIKYEEVQTEPQGIFVVEFNAIPHHGATNENTFQVQLFESGLVQCVYNTVTSDEDGAGTAVGTENADGTVGVRYNHSEFSASSGTDADVAFAVNFDPRPDPPTSLTASQVTGQPKVDLDWAAPDGSVDGYEVYRTFDGTTNELDTTLGPSDTSYHDDNLPADATCSSTLEYAVTATNGGTESEPAQVTITLGDCPSAPQAPNADGGDGQVQVRWDPPTDDGGSSIQTYHLYRCTGDGSGTCSSDSSLTQIDTVSADGSSSYTYPDDSDLDPGTEYCYQVTAENAVGEGDASTTVCGYTAPGAPTVDEPAANADGTVTVAWRGVSDQVVDSYTVYRKDPGGSFGPHEEQLESSPYTDNDVPDVSDGQKVCYKVSATNDGGEGAKSDEACIGTPGPVENLAALPGLQAATLVWTPPATGPQDAQTVDDRGDAITSYHVYRCRLGDHTAYLDGVGSWSSWADTSCQGPQVLDLDAAESSTTMPRSHRDSPEEGGTYGYRVHAVNNLGEGQASRNQTLVVQGTASLAPPSEPQHVDATGGKDEVEVTWEPPAIVVGNEDVGEQEVREPVTRYHVYRCTGDGGGSCAADSSLSQVDTVDDDGSDSYAYTDDNDGTGLPDAPEYCYAVSADRAGQGEKSSLSCTPLLGAPTILSTTLQTSTGTVELAWSEPEHDSDASVDYHVHRCFDPAENACPDPTDRDAYAEIDNGVSASPHDAALPDDLRCGGSVTYAVSADNDIQEGPQSEPATVSVDSGCPDAPTLDGVSSTGNAGELTLSWSGSGTSYHVYRCTGDGSGTCADTLSEIDTSASTSYLDDGLADDTQYCYEVSADNQVGEGARSNQVCATTPAEPEAPTADSVARTGSVGELGIDWSPPSNDGGSAISQYRVYRCTGDGSGSCTDSFQEVAPSQEITDTTYTDTGLEDATQYCYEIAAENDVDEGPRSNRLCEETYGPPGQPESFTVTVDADTATGEIDLEWDHPGTTGNAQIAYYKVYRRTATSTELSVVTQVDAPTDPTATVTHSDARGLDCSETYIYAVSAVNDVDLEGQQTPEKPSPDGRAPKDCPSEPLSLDASRGANKITLTWDPPGVTGGGIDQYRIYRSETSGGPFTERPDSPVNSCTTPCTFTDTDLGDGETWFYEVRAENSAGVGPAAGPVDATTFSPPGQPENVAAAGGPNANEITVEWSKPEKNGETDDGGNPITGYNIYRRAAEDTGHPVRHNATAADTFSFTDQPDRPGRFCYVVAAKNTIGEGPWSSETCAETQDPATAPPEAPGNLNADNRDDDGSIPLAAIELTWDASKIEQDGSEREDPRVTEYWIYRDGQRVDTVGGDTTYTDTDLSPVTYTYHVKAIVGTTGGTVSQSEASGEVTKSPFFDAPGSPDSLQLTRGPNAGQIELAWDEPENNGGAQITQYRVYRCTGDGSGSCATGSPLTEIDTVSDDGTSSYTYTDGSLADDTPYCYEVRAENEVPRESSPAAGCGYSPSKPAAPSISGVETTGTPGELDVSWNEPDDGGVAITQYHVYRQADDGSYPTTPTHTTSDGETTSYLDDNDGTGLDDGTEYCYKVSAENGVREGPKSSPLCGTTATEPAAPTIEDVTRTGTAGELKVDWSEPDDKGATIIQYHVYGCTGDGSGTCADTLSEIDTSTSTSYLDDGLADDTQYCYEVSAENGVDEGSTSSLSCGSTQSPPSAPSNPSASPGPSRGEITVSWAAPSDDGGLPVTSYNVYRATSETGTYRYQTTLTQLDPDGNGSPCGTGSDSDCKVTDEGLADGVTYYYKVSAENSIGEGAKSSSVDTSTYESRVPSAPGSLTAEAAPLPPDGASADTESPAARINVTNLEWTEPDDGSSPVQPPTHYVVYECNESGCADSSQIGEVPSSRQQYMVNESIDDGTSPNQLQTNLTPQRRHFRVAAVNDFGEGPNSGSVCTLGSPWAPLEDLLLTAGTLEPCASTPRDLTAESTATGEIELTWAPPENGAADTYNIYRRDAMDPSSEYGGPIDQADTNRYVDSPGQGAWAYQVTAVHGNEESPPSNEAIAGSTGPPPSESAGGQASASCYNENGEGARDEASVWVQTDGSLQFGDPEIQNVIDGVQVFVIDQKGRCHRGLAEANASAGPGAASACFDGDVHVDEDEEACDDDEISIPLQSRDERASLQASAACYDDTADSDSRNGAEDEAKVVLSSDPQVVLPSGSNVEDGVTTFVNEGGDCHRGHVQATVQVDIGADPVAVWICYDGEVHADTDGSCPEPGEGPPVPPDVSP